MIWQIIWRIRRPSVTSLHWPTRNLLGSKQTEWRSVENLKKKFRKKWVLYLRYEKLWHTTHKCTPFKWPIKSAMGVSYHVKVNILSCSVKCHQVIHPSLRNLYDWYANISIPDFGFYLLPPHQYEVVKKTLLIGLINSPTNAGIVTLWRNEVVWKSGTDSHSLKWWPGLPHLWYWI